jgi:hypothetical protein
MLAAEVEMRDQQRNRVLEVEVIQSRSVWIRKTLLTAATDGKNNA